MFIGQCDDDISNRGHQLHDPSDITCTKLDCDDPPTPPGSFALYRHSSIKQRRELLMTDKNTEIGIIIIIIILYFRHTVHSLSLIHI